MEQSVIGLLFISVPAKSLLEVRALQWQLPVSRGSVKKGSKGEAQGSGLQIADFTMLDKLQRALYRGTPHVGRF